MIPSDTENRGYTMNTKWISNKTCSNLFQFLQNLFLKMSSLVGDIADVCCCGVGGPRQVALAGEEELEVQEKLGVFFF